MAEASSDPDPDEAPYLVLTFVVYRVDEGVEVIARMGDHELGRSTGAHLSDVIPALAKGTAKILS